jgi:hypothetical protein
MQIYLPCEDDLFDASTAEAWANKAGPTLHEPATVSSLVRRLLLEPDVVLPPMGGWNQQAVLFAIYTQKRCRVGHRPLLLTGSGAEPSAVDGHHHGPRCTAAGHLRRRHLPRARKLCVFTRHTLQTLTDLRRVSQLPTDGDDRIRHGSGLPRGAHEQHVECVLGDVPSSASLTKRYS